MVPVLATVFSLPLYLQNKKAGPGDHAV